MGALAKWDPEDDILLKNAVETGASLESLAKGAVNFTKRFTLKELQDRWRSLLYDPVISAEASTRIIEVEANKTDPNPNPNMNLNQPCNKEKDVSQLGDKRKRDTVRSRYYSMRKRVSSCQPLETASMSGFVNNLENELQAYDNTDNNLGNELQPYDYQDNSINNNNNDHIAPFLSEEAAMGPPFEDYGEDLLMSPKICPSLEDDNKNLELETSNKPGITFRDPDPIWRSMQREKEQEVMSQSKSNEEDVVPNTEEISDFMDFSMDFSLPNDLFIDDKDIVDTSCSMFLNSPQDEAANNMLNNITGTQGDKKGNDVINNKNRNDMINNNNNTINNIVINNNTEIGNLVSDMGELVEKSSVCMLNTEHPDIPDNDDVCFDAVPSIPNPEYNSQTNNQNCEIISSSMQVSAERKGITGDLIEIKAGDPLVPVPVPGTMELPNAPTDPSILSKKEGFVPLTPLIRTTSGSHECSTNPVPVQTFNEPNPQLKDHAHQVENPNDALPENGDNAKYCTISGPNGCTMETGIITDQGATSAGGWVPLPDSDLDPLLASDNEEEEVFEESENDVPSFSDVEAMILEMDLSPYDQESLLSKEGMRFHSAEKRKSLIRLEQGARSYMNRAIVSRGSFAVLYGRHMKYFIKSPEVSIGRKTEDIKVDIDLGMEGPANKISRRQAIIKLDENGSFHIKNIGKCAIFVNSKEVPAKKRINLTSGALIEIRDMRFIFEVNEKAVGRYTFAMGRTCESQHNLCATYEWVPLQNL